MGGKSGSDDKRSSLDFFVPPEQTKPGSTGRSDDDARAYLEQRRQKHRDYLKAAKNAQRTISDLEKAQETLERARKLK